MKHAKMNIAPPPMEPGIGLTELIERHFTAYNAARLMECCRLWAQKLAEPDVQVGLTLSGALTPAGLGGSCLAPLVARGFVDFIVSTGANLYHDAHFGLGLPLHPASPHLDDRELRRDGLVRIYDIVMDYHVLLKTDAFFRQILAAPEFDRPMGTAEFHYLAGRYLAERQRVLGIEQDCLLAACHRMEVPVYTSSPGDSSIGMNAAAMALTGSKFAWDANRDVNETAGLILAAKRAGHKTAVVILGGGSPKNFMLQTEPHIQEVLGISEKGHDYFMQITDARPDTGGLSGATPSEAVSWGKVDPDSLPDNVVCYTDSTIALPLITAYLFAKRVERQPRRLYTRRDEVLKMLANEAKIGE